METKRVKLVQKYTLIVTQEVDVIDPDDSEEIGMAQDALENAVWLDVHNIGQEIPYRVSVLSMESCWVE